MEDFNDSVTEIETEGASQTDEELNLISKRAAEIQRELRSEILSSKERRKQPRRKLRLDSNSSQPAPPGTLHNLGSIQSDLDDLNQLLSDKINEASSAAQKFGPTGSTVLGRVPGISGLDFGDVIQNREISALDEAIQTSLDRIKRNVHLSTDDESEGTTSGRRTPVNFEVAKATSLEGPASELTPIIRAMTKETAEVVESVTQQNYQRRVNLLKYELEAEKKSSAAKISMLTEELKNSKEVIEVSSQRNFELNQEIEALGVRLREEMTKSHELNRTLKTKVAQLVQEVDNFRAFEREFEVKLQEKEEFTDQLQEDLKERKIELENLKENYAKQLSSLKDDLEEAKNGYEKNLNNIKEQHRVANENLTDYLNKRHEVNMKELKRKTGEERQGYEEEIEELKLKMKGKEQEHDTEMRKQKQDFQERLETQITEERSTAEFEKQEALKRQQIRLEDEMQVMKKRMMDDLDNEKRRCLESERMVESLRHDLNNAKEDLGNLQKESVDAIKETQKTCEVAADMKLTQLRDELNDEHANELQNSRIQYQAMLKDKQTADLDIERLTNKVAEIEEKRTKEQKKILVKINRACADISNSIGIQPRQVYVGSSPPPVPGESKLGSIVEDESFNSGSKMNFDLLMKSGLDNLNAIAREVSKYSADHYRKVQEIREQFATYQAQRDIEVSDIRHHCENETGRMIEYAKDRLHQKYMRDLDHLRGEIRRDNDVESALRKTVDRQHAAILSMKKSKKSAGAEISADSGGSSGVEKTRKNIHRLQKLNSKVDHMNNFAHSG